MAHFLTATQGCHLIEWFAQDTVSEAVYAPEYHDHPTLDYVQKQSPRPATFAARPAGSEQNAGNQTTPLQGIPEIQLGHLDGSGWWDLGPASESDRGALFETKLQISEPVPAHTYEDWRCFIVWDGSLHFCGRELTANDVVIVKAESERPAYEAGKSGADLIEMVRTPKGLDSR